LSKARIWAFSLLALKRADGRDALIDQRLQELAGDGFGQALFAGEREEEVVATVPIARR